LQKIRKPQYKEEVKGASPSRFNTEVLHKVVYETFKNKPKYELYVERLCTKLSIKLSIKLYMRLYTQLYIRLYAQLMKALYRARKLYYRRYMGSSHLTTSCGRFH